MKRGKIKAIIFDVGGVLVLGAKLKRIKYDGRLHHTEIHEEISRKLKISLDQWFDAIDTTYAKSIEGKISKEEVLETISKNVKTSKRKLRNIMNKVYKKNFDQNKQLFEKAFELKRKGYKIGVLSDQWHFSQEALMPKILYKKFNEVVVSPEVGMRKPNPKMYKLILKRLKLPANQTLFIDNQEWNIKPAKKLGMETILYKNNKQLFKELDKLKI
ncbi:HAD family phosphatase [Candidatus Pacearchaeota archaeon]|nr:HAD family phosphatase [Candidatus Pacearchaeota archaeon]